MPSSSFTTLALASALTYLYTYSSQASLSITNAVLLTCSIFLLLYLIWSLFLRPVYFSPLRNLPGPARKSWKHFFKIYNPNEVLEFVDTVPNNGIIRYLDILNSEMISITDPKLVAEMLGPRADHLNKRPKIKVIMESILGNGLVVAEGKDHKYQRKHLLPAFNHKVIKNLYPTFWSKATEMTSLMTEQIQSSSPKDLSMVVDFDDWAGRVSLDIIGLAGFGSAFHALSSPETDLNTAYRAAFLPNKNSRMFFILSLLTHPTLVYMLPIEHSKRLREGVNAVTRWIRGFIAKRQHDKPEKTEGSTFVHQDIISAAMEGGAFGVENLVDQSKTLLGAGHETSATAVTWGIYLLSQPRYAHIQNRLRQEVREYLPSPSSGIEVTEDMLEKLPYLDAVSKEILRVYAPVPLLGRIVHSPMEIGGVTFPKGTVLLVHMWAINKSKKLWGEDAHEFNPDRWLKDKVNGGATENGFLSFGAGTRSCIGRGFAIAENKALLAQLIGSFDIKPPHGETEDLDISWGITARIVGGLHMKTSVLEGW
ncbi:cytochrome P450 [Mollisia scopiformis]|uniref:Cytochrome P450 n=1 Tax=Mollisia scopiformis TaxID=149040 RepID=A0A132B4T5_MOLSC|nr:cytochrome P450 [Mollisia scopiformis]KUJ07418.1 cytochrome P450 [Mollisia scopiformis]